MIELGKIAYIIYRPTHFEHTVKPSNFGHCFLNGNPLLGLIRAASFFLLQIVPLKADRMQNFWSYIKAESLPQLGYISVISYRNSHYYVGKTLNCSKLPDSVWITLKKHGMMGSPN